MIGLCADCFRHQRADAERDRRAQSAVLYRERERTRNASERRQAWKRTYYREHLSHFAENQREYRQRHPDKANGRWAKWYAENPEKVADKRHRADAVRRARKAAVEATLTRAQWTAIKAAYGHRCAYCGGRFKHLTQDHVIPLSDGGATVPANIVPACRPCNSRKNNRPAPTVPAIRLLL